MKSFFPLLLALSLAACTSTPERQTANERQYGRDLAAAGFGVVLNGCVLFDGGSKKRLLLDESEAVIAALHQRLRELAQTHEIPLKKVLKPLLCSDLPRATRDELAVLRGVPTLGRRSLLPSGSSAQTNSLERLELLDRFLEISWSAVDIYRGEIALGSEIPFSISPAHTRTISADLDARFAVIMRGFGVAMTEGEQFKSTILRGLGSPSIDDGKRWSESLPGEGLVYQLALIDLNKNRILWAKTSTFTAGDARDPMSYRGPWTQDLLMPLFEKAANEYLGAPDAPFFR